MSASGITYEGVLAQSDTNLVERRKLFTGLTFWISAYVGTHRAMCKGRIEENGGTVAKAEKQASILLVDPAKPDPPPGSYSYKLIEDAIKEGSLDKKEQYLCRPPISDLTVASPSAASKTTRNKFTPEEDRMLMQFVIDSERLGEPIGGNEIYKQFAYKHPTHTWQSWQDRWRKKLKLLPRPAIFSDPMLPPQTQPTPQAASGTTSDEHSSSVRKGTRFKPGEDKILLETIHQAILNRERWKENHVYKRLSEDFPQRTYQSWRERAIHHVAIQHADQIRQWESECGGGPNNEDDVSETPRDEHAQERRDESHIKPTVTPSPRKNNSLKDRGAQNVPDSAGRQANHTGNAGVTSSPRGSVDLTGLPESERGQQLGYATSSRSASAAADGPDSVAETTRREQFVNDYNTWMENSQLGARPDPSIGGKEISLWELWEIVRSKKVVAAELDWQQIAEDLGFNWPKSPSIPEELRQCYDAHLAPFADAISCFDVDADDSDEDESDRYSQVDMEDMFPSSPPMRASRKRSIDSHLPLPEQTPQQASSKRRKTDPNNEIPSTPEYLIGTANLRHLSQPDKSQHTPLQTFHTPGDGMMGTEEDEEPMDQLADLPEPQKNGNRRDPETQDFHFDPDTQDSARGGTPIDVENDTQMTNTPSQQLQRESDDAVSVEIERQVESPTSIRSRRKVVQSTPTLNRKTKLPFLPDDSDDGLFLEVDSAGKGNESTRRDRILAATLRASNSPRFASPNRRSPKPTTPSLFATKPNPDSKQIDDIAERFIMLGYPEDIVLRALKATSWKAGNAGHLMEILKRGDPLPRNTTGIWTQRDDDALRLVCSEGEPINEKEQKKRAKKLERLQRKHGDEQIATRKWYLWDKS
ncbi:hypothetical protein GGR57DRAFT_508465 [Xylariaceae sp. FL1272]|nr:hypothetical protein GGR57DRAFT_508465 [Xylariaceae sp. FL1272]